MTSHAPPPRRLAKRDSAGCGAGWSGRRDGKPCDERRLRHAPDARPGPATAPARLPGLPRLHAALRRHAAPGGQGATRSAIRALAGRRDVTRADVTCAVATRADVTRAVVTRADVTRTHVTRADITRTVLRRGNPGGEETTRTIVAHTDDDSDDDDDIQK